MEQTLLGEGTEEEEEQEKDSDEENRSDLSEVRAVEVFIAVQRRLCIYLSSETTDHHYIRCKILNT